MNKKTKAAEIGWFAGVLPGCAAVIFIRLWLGIVCAGEIVTLASSAPTREWVAHTTDSPNWSEPGNWSPAGVPQNGDDLIFHATEETPAPRLEMNNDLVDLVVRDFLFCGLGWSLNGNELTLLNNVDRTNIPTNLCGASSVVFHCPLKLGNSTVIDMYYGLVLLRGNIDHNGNNLGLISADTIRVSGQITGTGDVFATIDSFTSGSTLSVQGDITIMNDSLFVMPTIRGKLGLPGSTASAPPKKQTKATPQPE